MVLDKDKKPVTLPLGRPFSAMESTIIQEIDQAIQEAGFDQRIIRVEIDYKLIPQDIHTNKLSRTSLEAFQQYYQRFAGWKALSWSEDRIKDKLTFQLSRY